MPYTPWGGWGGDPPKTMFCNITSLNVKGLQANLKRKKLSNELNLIRRDIILLQETHSTTSCENFWRNDFKMSKAYYSHGTSAARGVAIMLNLREDFEIVAG